MRLDAYIKEAQLDSLEAEERLIRHKSIIREYARATRNEIQTLEPASPHVRRSMVESIGRTIWFRDLKLASLVLDNNRQPGATLMLSMGFQPSYLNDISVKGWRRRKLKDWL